MRAAVVLLALAACGGRAATTRGDLAALRPACAAGHRWDGAACVAPARGVELIDRGAAALTEFRVDEALPLLEQARDAGPYAFADHVRLYEQLGIAYAYLEREGDALRAFETLLILDPGHLLSYTLSPRATFLFEKARTAAAARPRTAVDLSWPRTARTTEPLPVEIEVVADPGAVLATATLHMRARGDAGYRAVDVALPAVGGYRTVALPPLGVRADTAVELYLTAFDAAGNEVLLWAGPEQPRDVPLRYIAPTPWYRKWWVWAAVGSAVAIGTGTTVYVLTRDPPGTVGGDVELVR